MIIINNVQNDNTVYMRTMYTFNNDSIPKFHLRPDVVTTHFDNGSNPQGILSLKILSGM